MKTTIVLVAALTLWACAADDAPTVDANAGNGQLPDTLYVNGVIWTGVNGAPDATVLAVKDGVVAHVGDGSSAGITAKETVDLDGRFLMSGFIDNHVHFFEGGAGLASVDLRDAATPDEFSRRTR